MNKYYYKKTVILARIAAVTPEHTLERRGFSDGKAME
jgi:hypothetical protein